jgi:hypothetical protein
MDSGVGLLHLSKDDTALHPSLQQRASFMYQIASRYQLAFTH